MLISLLPQVTGASDKTLRQWDLTTGQCVMTMDILWAMSHPPSSVRGASSGNTYTESVTGPFAVPTPPYADGSWDMYEDFVGGVQFWGYGLVSGSGDGAVRMWDSMWTTSFIGRVYSLFLPSADWPSSSHLAWTHSSSELSTV